MGRLQRLFSSSSGSFLVVLLHHQILKSFIFLFLIKLAVYLKLKHQILVGHRPESELWRFFSIFFWCARTTMHIKHLSKSIMNSWRLFSNPRRPNRLINRRSLLQSRLLNLISDNGKQRFRLKQDAKYLRLRIIKCNIFKRKHIFGLYLHHIIYFAR